MDRAAAPVVAGLWARAPLAAFYRCTGCLRNGTGLFPAKLRPVPDDDGAERNVWQRSPVRGHYPVGAVCPEEAAVRRRIVRLSGVVDGGGISGKPGVAAWRLGHAGIFAGGLAGCDPGRIAVRRTRDHFHAVPVRQRTGAGGAWRAPSRLDRPGTVCADTGLRLCAL